jgi:hypothetical protein
MAHKRILFPKRHGQENGQQFGHLTRRAALVALDLAHQFNAATDLHGKFAARQTQLLTTTAHLGTE